LGRSAQVEPVQSFGFDHHFALNDQVSSIPPDNDTTEHDFKRHFTFNSQAGVLERHREGVRVHGLRESHSEGCMDVVHPANDGVRQFMMQ